MKKGFLIISLILLALKSYGGEAKKKSDFHSEIKFGIEGGLNIANIIYQGKNANANSDFAILWHVSAYSSIGLSDKVSFQPELGYSVKGNAFEASPNTSYTNQLGYAEMPLLIKDDIGKQFSLFIGPYIGILVGHSSSFETTIYSNSNVPTNTNAGLNMLDIGGVIGVGYEYNSGFNYGLKCSAGFTNVSRKYDDVNIIINPIPMTNLVFSLYLGWTFK